MLVRHVLSQLSYAPVLSSHTCSFEIILDLNSVVNKKIELLLRSNSMLKWHRIGKLIDFKGIDGLTELASCLDGLPCSSDIIKLALVQR